MTNTGLLTRCQCTASLPGGMSHARKLLSESVPIWFHDAKGWVIWFSYIFLTPWQKRPQLRCAPELCLSRPMSKWSMFMDARKIPPPSSKIWRSRLDEDSGPMKQHPACCTALLLFSIIHSLFLSRRETCISCLCRVIYRLSLWEDHTAQIFDSKLHETCFGHLSVNPSNTCHIPHKSHFMSQSCLLLNFS